MAYPRLLGLFAACLVLVAGSCMPQEVVPPQQPISTQNAVPPPTVSKVPITVADGIENPWGIDWLPDGSALVTQRTNNKILRLIPGQKPEVVGELTDADVSGPGVRGIAIGPDFFNNHHVYIYYGTATENKVVRMPFYVNKLGTPENIVTGIPRGSRGNGGALEFGPGKILYIGTGDVGQPQLAQNLKSLAGKILRVDLDGRAAGRNPFGDSMIWSTGHSDVIDLAFDRGFHLVACEQGLDGAADLINVVEEGGNYGWGDQKKRTHNALFYFQDEKCNPGGITFGPDGHFYVSCQASAKIWDVNWETLQFSIFFRDGGPVRNIKHGPYRRLWVMVGVPKASVMILPNH